MRIAVSGSGSEALLAGALGRDQARPGVRGVTADITLADSMLPGVRVLAALPGTCAHWRLQADAERTYWETGGPAANPVMVTAAGFVDASAWQAHGGLAGLGPHGFAQGSMSDGMYPGPLLKVLTEQAVTGSPRFAPAPRRTRRARPPPRPRLIRSRRAPARWPASPGCPARTGSGG